MWLPKPLYEALPVVYIVVGTLFLAGVAYVGFSVQSTLFYLVLGIVCVFTGLYVYHVRAKARAVKASHQQTTGDRG